MEFALDCGAGGFIFVPNDDPDLDGPAPEDLVALAEEAAGVFWDVIGVRPDEGGVVGVKFPDPDGSPATNATAKTRAKKIMVLLEFIILTEKKKFVILIANRLSF